MRAINQNETLMVAGGFNPLGLAAITALSCAIIFIGAGILDAPEEATLTLLTAAFLACNAVAFFM